MCFSGIRSGNGVRRLSGVDLCITLCTLPVISTNGYVLQGMENNLAASACILSASELKTLAVRTEEKCYSQTCSAIIRETIRASNFKMWKHLDKTTDALSFKPEYHANVLLFLLSIAPL